MNLNITKEQLLNPLQKVFGVIEKRQTLPILSNVYFNLNHGLLQLTGTDYEVQISSTSTIDNVDSYRTTIPARKLLDICRSLPDESVLNLSFQENQVIIKSGKSRFTLQTLSPEEYPLFDESNYLTETIISQEALHQAFSKTIFCMAQQDVRYYLNGLMFEVKASSLQTVASDGHRLAFTQHELENVNDIDQVIIPRKAAQEIFRLLSATDGIAKIKVSKNNIRIEVGDVILNAKLIDGRFPDFKNILPEESKQNFLINKETFKSALARVSILSNEKYRGIRLDFKPNLMVINANNPEQDEAEEEVQIDYSFEEASIGFNASYLMEALNVIDSEEVRISFTDTNSSCLLENPNDQSSRFVIMPMRI